MIDSLLSIVINMYSKTTDVYLYNERNRLSETGDKFPHVYGGISVGLSIL